MKKSLLLLLYLLIACTTFAQKCYHKEDLSLAFTQERDPTRWEYWGTPKVPYSILPMPDGNGVMYMFAVKTYGKYLCMTFSKKNDIVFLTEDGSFTANDINENWDIQKQYMNLDLDVDHVYLLNNGKELRLIFGINPFSSGWDTWRDSIIIDINESALYAKPKATE